MARFTNEVSARPEHLKMIRQARPLVNPEIEESEIKDPEISGAYQVYNVGLAELKTARVALKAAPMLRVEELGTARKISAAYELNTSARETEIPAVHTDAKYLARLNTGFEAAEKVARASTAAPKMRVINVPALHTEAYWLHYEDPGKDVVIPIHSFDFPEGVPVPYAVFMQKLSEAAKAVPDTSSNELGG